MMRFFAWLSAVFIAAVGVSWMLNHKGAVVLTWLGYEIRTSFAFLCFAIVAIASLLFLVYFILHTIVNATDRYGQDRSLRRQRQGITAITRAYAALAVSDTALAQRMNQQAQKYLGRIPLTLLLDAQLARVEGDDRRTRLYLEEMLDSKETEFVAMRGLIEHARQNGNISEALKLAERARDNKNKESWTTPTLIDLYCREGRWQEALQTIDQAVRQRKATLSEARHLRTVTYTIQAEKLHAGGEYSLATSFARKASKLSPDFIPAILVNLRSLVGLSEEKDAEKLIRKIWKYAPHPLLATEFMEWHEGEDTAEILRHAEKLAAVNPTALASKMLLAEAYLNARRWPQAHAQLTEIITLEESAQACQWMARLQKEGFGNLEEAERWLLRAATANASARWICHSCGHESAHWLAHCPECKSFDSYHWQSFRKFHIEPAALV